jgi:sortase (surface protein transpeptidase)
MHYALVGMGVFVFAVGVFVSVMTAQTNHAASQTVEALSRANNQPATSTAAEPSTIKPGENAVNNFVVAPKMPRYLNIPRLGVHARILSLGILNNGELATPGNIYDVGWYNESSSPGQTGAMMVEGYAASGMAEGVFYDLGKLKAGDQVQVVRGDGSIFSYRVVRNQHMGSDANDMNAAMNPVTADRPGLNLITTADQSGNRHSHGIIVFTEQI